MIRKSNKFFAIILNLIISFNMATDIVFANPLECPIDSVETEQDIYNKFEAESTLRMNSGTDPKIKIPLPRRGNVETSIYNMPKIFSKDADNFVRACAKALLDARKAADRAIQVGRDNKSRLLAFISDLTRRLKGSEELDTIQGTFGIKEQEAIDSVIYCTNLISMNNLWSVGTVAGAIFSGIKTYCWYAAPIAEIATATGTIVAVEAAKETGAVVVAEAAKEAGATVLTRSASACVPFVGWFITAGCYAMDVWSNYGKYHASQVRNNAELLSCFYSSLRLRPEEVLDSNILIMSIDKGNQLTNCWLPIISKFPRNKGVWYGLRYLPNLRCAPKAREIGSFAPRMIEIMREIMTNEQLDYNKIDVYINGGGVVGLDNRLLTNDNSPKIEKVNEEQQ